MADAERHDALAFLCLHATTARVSYLRGSAPGCRFRGSAMNYG